MSKMLIAIDGPAGSGKSTVAVGLSRRLELPRLDTGSMYRALALAALESDVDLVDEYALLHLLADVSITWDGNEIYVDGKAPGDQIRSDRVSHAASMVAAHPGVRSRMVKLQRDFVDGAPKGAVVEGRDIGTVVLPDAPLKIFLTAHPGERARRRASDSGSSLEDSSTAVETRDRRDSERQASPLTAAGDARVIDTTEQSAEEVVELIAGLAEKISS